LALDLFTAGLLDGTEAYVLAAIEHATRRIRILGAAAHPGGQWIVQQARNLCMDLDQAGASVKFVLHDRDAILHEGVDAVFTAAGLRIVRSGVRMPRMNSIMERWIGGCRRELLDRTLIWNLPHLRRILSACECHQPGSPGTLLHRGPLRTAHARSRAHGPGKPLGRFQVVCCITVFPASRDGCFVRWQVACTRCVRLPRTALGVSWWTR